jgi:hypothetical protein
MTVSEAMRLHPSARWIFAAWNLGSCSHCATATEETLEQLAVSYSLPLEKLLDDLNCLVDGRSDQNR